MQVNGAKLQCDRHEFSILCLLKAIINSYVLIKLVLKSIKLIIKYLDVFYLFYVFFKYT